MLEINGIKFLDPHTEAFDSTPFPGYICSKCGAIVINPNVHAKWHTILENLLADLIKSMSSRSK